jgi:hypothetical protein
MTMEITIQVPETIGQQLQAWRQRLPEIVERGLREVLAEESSHFQDENTIIKLLTSHPAPEQVIAIRPSPELQARVSELLQRNKHEGLSRREEVELERHLMLEHLVRLAKAYAYEQLSTQQ